MMLNKKIFALLIVFVSLFITAPAQAHILSSEGDSMIAGIVHPFQGLDHLLTMLAVGLWAFQQGGKRLWLIPGTFLSMMIFGAFLGCLGYSLPLVETGIAGSLLIMGVLLMFAIRLSMLPGMLIVGLFAIFHGYAHGAEIPEASGLFDYGIGFLFSTAALHVLGIGLGLFAQSIQSEKLLRLGGFVIGMTGISLLT